MIKMIPIFYEAAQNDLHDWKGFQLPIFYATLYKIGIRLLLNTTASAISVNQVEKWQLTKGCEMRSPLLKVRRLKQLIRTYALCSKTRCVSHVMCFKRV
jgi:hypothetical protein